MQYCVLSRAMGIEGWVLLLWHVHAWQASRLCQAHLKAAYVPYMLQVALETESVQTHCCRDLRR